MKSGDQLKTLNIKKKKSIFKNVGGDKIRREPTVLLKPLPFTQCERRGHRGTLVPLKPWFP